MEVVRLLGREAVALVLELRELDADARGGGVDVDDHVCRFFAYAGKKIGLNVQTGKAVRYRTFSGYSRLRRR